MGRRVLITGIEGFTGRHLQRHLLDRGYEVYGTTLRSAGEENEFSCDLLDEGALTKAIEWSRPNFVIHTAGISYADEKSAELYYRVNVVGTENLLKACGTMSNPPEKVILASSATVYGARQKSPILEESMCPRPVRHYGSSKLAMERIAEGWFERFPILIVRPFNYTGPGQDRRFVVPKIVESFRSGRKEIELGNVEVEREFNDVRYVVGCYRALLEAENARSTIVNIASERPVRLLKIVEVLESITGRSMEVRIDRKLIRPNEPPSLTGSVRKLESYIERPALPDLEETLRWMLNG